MFVYIQKYYLNIKTNSWNNIPLQLNIQGRTFMLEPEHSDTEIGGGVMGVQKRLVVSERVPVRVVNVNFYPVNVPMIQKLVSEVQHLPQKRFRRHWPV